MRDKAEGLRTMIESGILLVIRQDSADAVLRIIDAVVRGGVKVIEITLTVPNALDIVKAAVKDFGTDILIGAGTVLDSETARASILAGADFIVGPCCSEAVLATCKRYSRIAIPGAMTPTEILRAAELGADIVKVFPIDHLGRAEIPEDDQGPASPYPSQPERKHQRGQRAGIPRCGGGGHLRGQRHPRQESHQRVQVPGSDREGEGDQGQDAGVEESCKRLSTKVRNGSR